MKKRSNAQRQMAKYGSGKRRMALAWQSKGENEMKAK
jgi:hypothetical protein